ncbi:DUF6629 family protein [Sphingobium herbicidovorans]|nr:hypothetical protein K663_06315 [Sphingobium sp. MI1205]
MSRICYSASASFVASGVIGSIGVATLSHVREPRALLFAAVPLLFAAHQFTEGFVWLGLDGRIGPVALDHVTFLFMFYAQGVLPFLMPLAVLLMEPPGQRRSAIMALTVLGALVCAWMIYGLIFFESTCSVEQYSIAYRNPLTGNFGVSLLYILATCGALVLSTHRVVRWYGVLNIIGLTIAQLVKEFAFASVWCFYAATLSMVIYWQFRRRNIDVETPNGTSPFPRPFLLPWLRLNGAAVSKPQGTSGTDL